MLQSVEVLLVPLFQALVLCFSHKFSHTAVSFKDLSDIVIDVLV